MRQKVTADFSSEKRTLLSDSAVELSLYHCFDTVLNIWSGGVYDGN